MGRYGLNVEQSIDYSVAGVIIVKVYNKVRFG